MASTKHIEDLPYEVIVKIFSYLSILDLVLSVKHVSCRWHAVAQDIHLWKKIQYTPSGKESKEEVVNILQQSPMLETLILSERPFSSSVLFAFLKYCSELKILKLCRIQKFSLPDVRALVMNCQKLEDLTIMAHVVCIFEAMNMIGRLDNLKTLRVVGGSNCSRFLWLRPLSDGCPLLQHLDIQHQKVSSVDLKYFMGMKQHQLQSIKVRWLTYEGKCTTPYLTVCKTLNEVLITLLEDIETNAGFEALKCMKNVTTLTFDYANQSYDVHNFVNLFSNEGMCHLIQVKIENYRGYRDELSEAICINCPLLKVLSFKDCHNITDRSLENLYKLKELQFLNVSGGRNITDIGMDFVLKCKNLKYLNISGCIQLTEKCMKQLIDLNLLEHLILDFCNIEGLLISTRWPKLRILSVNFCGGVNLEVVHQLRAEMPHLNLYTEFL